MYRTQMTIAVLSALERERWQYQAQVVARTLIERRRVSHILKRLEAAGFVESETEPARPEQTRPERGHLTRRGRRKYYRLTDAGVALERKWRAQ